MLKFINRFKSWRGASSARETTGNTEPSLTLTVTGMTCQHCVERVRQAILAVGGVSEVQIDLKSSTARIFGQFDHNAVVEAVRNAGYETA